MIYHKSHKILKYEPPDPGDAQDGDCYRGLPGAPNQYSTGHLQPEEVQAETETRSQKDGSHNGQNEQEKEVLRRSGYPLPRVCEGVCEQLEQGQETETWKQKEDG
eukprot:sb/3477885/